MKNALVKLLSKLTTKAEEILPDILVLDFTIVTACIAGTADKWAMVDTGLSNSFDFILDSSVRRFNTRPEAIILTHGHFDHVGSVVRLSEHWNVPVFAHPLEMPYLTGAKNYPEADPSVDEGMMAKMSPAFPHTDINIRFRLAELPADGSVPGMQGWRWIHTPGHTEGHISLFRDSDRALIAGDAFTAVKQESLFSVLTRKERIKGPPAYLTTDWEKAKESVELLKDLRPELAIPSHGRPMSGKKLQEHLELLAKEFDDIAVPDKGRYTDRRDQ